MIDNQQHERRLIGRCAKVRRSHKALFSRERTTTKVELIIDIDDGAIHMRGPRTGQIVLSPRFPCAWNLGREMSAGDGNDGTVSNQGRQRCILEEETRSVASTEYLVRCPRTGRRGPPKDHKERRPAVALGMNSTNATTPPSGSKLSTLKVLSNETGFLSSQRCAPDASLGDRRRRRRSRADHQPDMSDRTPGMVLRLRERGCGRGLSCASPKRRPCQSPPCWFDGFDATRRPCFA